MVVIETILIESVTLSWRIPLFTTQEQYYVEYGTDPLNLDQKSASIISPTDTSLLNQMYSETISGLDSSTLYYLRVVAEFDVVSKRRSDIYSIWTKDYGTFDCMMNQFISKSYFYRTRLLFGDP